MLSKFSDKTQNLNEKKVTIFTIKQKSMYVIIQRQSF